MKFQAAYLTRRTRKKRALLNFEWVPKSLIATTRPGGRRFIPTPAPAPRRCLPQALERNCGRSRIKGSLRRATPALDLPPSITAWFLVTYSKFKKGMISTSRHRYHLLQQSCQFAGARGYSSSTALFRSAGISRRFCSRSA